MDIIKDNEMLVYSIINNYTNVNNKEDLYQVGMIGLIKAYENYDSSKGAKFSTYAYMYILGEIKKYVLENRGLKISRDLNKLSLKIEKARLILSQKLMHEPTIKELSNYLEIDEYTLIEAMNSNNQLQSLDNPIKQDDKEVTLYDYIPSLENYSIDDLIALKDEITKLPRHDQKIIYHRYMQDLTQSEVAKKLAISQVQVSRDEAKILTKLKNRLT
jgi:RNA polymerase sporulation-specific sigma factor